MTKNEDAARQRAFESGQQAWRDGKSIDANPYPEAAERDHQAWRQGWEQEQELLD
ncbi:MAG TPA: hypothetical protein PKE16_13015 [Hyphomicrobium sp.]|nr:hypothetical protein [Hyphomicrobium sp.]